MLINRRLEFDLVTFFKLANGENTIKLKTIFAHHKKVFTER